MSTTASTLSTQTTQEQLNSNEEIKFEPSKKNDASERALRLLQETREKSQNVFKCHFT